MRFTIARKLALGFGGSVALMATVAGLGLYMGQQAGKSNAELVQLADTIRVAGELDGSMRQLRLATNRYAVEPSPERAKQFEDATKDVRTYRDNLTKMSENAEVAKVVETIATTSDAYESAARALIAATDKRFETFYKQCGPTGEKLEATVRELAKHVQDSGDSKHVQDSGDSKHAELAYEALASVNLTRLGVTRFLVTNDKKEFEKATVGSKSISDNLQILAKYANAVIHRELAAEGLEAFYKQCGPTGEKLEATVHELAKHVHDSGDSKHVQDSDDSKHAELAYEALASVNLTRLGVARFLVTNDKKEFEKVTIGSKSVSDNLQILAKDAKAVAHRELAAEGLETLNKYIAIGTEVFELQQTMVEDRKEKLDPMGVKLGQLSMGLNQALTNEKREVQAAAEATLAKEMMMVKVVGGIALLTGVFTALFTARSITKPINLLIERLKDIAQGEADLTRRVDEQRPDELGELGKWFNAFVVRIQDIMLHVRGSAQDVAAAATEIAASSEEMARGMDQQAEQVTQISSAVQEMAASVVEVGAKSATARDRAEASGRSATQGGQVVAETVAGMQSINEAVSASSASVTELGKRGEQIGEIIKVINDIADQTNLLALNAAIEAARAGEHGRGFAVVADEVRKLAERTQKATEEVGESIRAIQDETRTAVERMDGGTKQVEVGVQKAQAAGESLNMIVNNAKDVAVMIQTIAAAAEQQGSASEQISRSLENINSVTREATSGAAQAAQASSELSSKAEQLRELVSRFKLADANSSSTTTEGKPAAMKKAAYSMKQKVAA